MAAFFPHDSGSTALYGGNRATTSQPICSLSSAQCDCSRCRRARWFEYARARDLARAQRETEAKVRRLKKAMKRDAQRAAIAAQKEERKQRRERPTVQKRPAALRDPTYAAALHARQVAQRRG